MQQCLGSPALERAIQATCYGTRPNHGVPQLRGVRQDLSGETTRVGTSCGGDVLEINTHSPTRFERPAERRYTGRDLNRKPLDEIGCYGTAWKIADLLGFTREDLAVRFGV